MPSCIIKQCSARKNINQPGLSLHRFPTNEIQKRKWLDVIGIENINTHHKIWRVCSLHFDEACINRTLDVIRLHDGAIPSSPLPISLDKMRPGNRQKNIAKKSCRACLASEVKLFSIHDNNLANSYYQLVGISLKDIYSQHLCGICATMLRKFAQFRERCQKAYSLLSDEKFYCKTVLTALYFYAHGDYQKPFGRVHFVAQQTASTAVAEVTAALNSIEMRNKYIKFPRTTQERQVKKLRFYNKFGIPGVMGCIDCTHVRIVKPIEYEDRYFCRKKIHSLNVQLIKDIDVTAYIPPLPYSKTDIQIHEYIYMLEEHIEDFDLKQEQEVCVGKEEFDDFDNVIIDDVDNIDKEDNITELKTGDNDDKVDDDDEIEDLEIKNEDTDSDEENMTVAHLVNNDVVYKKEKRPIIDSAIKNKTVNTIPEAKVVPKTKQINETSKRKNIKKRPKTQEELKALAESYDFEVKFLTEKEQYEEIEERKRQASKREASQLPVCDYCGKTFSSKQRLEIHYKRDHDPSAGDFLCKICHCRFSRRCRLTQHMSSHPVLFQCKICTYNSKWHNSMIYHSSTHKGKVHVCEYCQKICEKLTTYFSHVRLHHASELPSCDICGESFVNNRGVKFHKTKAHKGVVLSFECTVCGKKFISQDALDRHVGLEKCDLDCCVHCGEGFASLQLLKYHLIQVHTPESLSVNCEGCNVKFHSAAALQRHLWKCGNAACCVQCGEHFDDESLMRDHVVKEHSDFKCKECNKTFTNAFYYRDHVAKHRGQQGKMKDNRGRHIGRRKGPPIGRVKKWRPGHEGEVTSKREPRAPKKRSVVCEICGKSFRYNAKLQMHLHLHTGERPFQCDRCTKAFKTAVALEYHMRVHTGERPFKCTSCPKAFKQPCALARHELVHSGVRKHVCQICEKTFQTSSCVKMHIRHVHMKIPARPRVRRRKLKSVDN